ncbi:RraA family protein [Achromobacter aloeverae]
MSLAPKQTDRRWKDPVLPFVSNPAPERLPADLVAALAGMDVTRVADAVGRMYTCQSPLRSLTPTARPLCGTALTVKCPPGDNLGLMAGIRQLQPGDVLVVDGQGFTSWCLGGAELLKFARDEYGMAGLVVHGAWRDAQELEEAEIPVYGLGVAPYSGPKLGPAEVNVPVACAGVIVQPGDVVCASLEGVAVVPRAHARRVADRLSQAAAGHGIAAFMDDMDVLVRQWLDRSAG